MKKLLSLLVAVLILLALCACKEDGSSAKTPEKKSGSDQATDHYVTLAFGVSKDALQEDLTEHIDCRLVLSTEPVDS